MVNVAEINHRRPTESLEIPAQFVLDSQQLVITLDGRSIKAHSLPHESNMVYLSTAISDVFECFTRNRRAIYIKALNLMQEFNLKSTNNTFEPVVVVHKPEEQTTQNNHYLLPVRQQELFIDLLKQHEAEFEDLLPFRVTQKEMNALHNQDPQATEKIFQRAIRVFSPHFEEKFRIPSSISKTMITEILSHETIWQLLLNSELPVDSKSDFQKAFRTSIYRRGLNWYRDHQKHIERWKQSFYFLEEGSSLRKLLESNSLESTLVQKLLSFLTPEQRQAFLLNSYFNLNSGEISRALEIKPETVAKRINKAKKTLTRIAQIPVDEWPKPRVHVVLETIAIANPELFSEWIRSFSSKNQVIYAIFHFENNLSNSEIARRMNLSIGAIKSLGFRVKAGLLEKALEEQVVTPKDVDITSGYTVFEGIAQFLSE